MEKAKVQVLIVGAGPTGLVLALRLAAHGVRIRIVDQHAGPGEASRAMTVQARTLEFYQQLGWGDAVAALGIPIEQIRFREDGKQVKAVSMHDIGRGRSPYPYVLCFPQDDHERFLVERLRDAGIEIEWHTELKSFTQNDRGVQAVLDCNHALSELEVDYLCGCDGAHSTVRQGLGGVFPGDTYAQVFFVADVKVAGPFRHDLCFNFSRHDMVLMMPVRSRAAQRLIGIVPAELAGRDDLSFDELRPYVTHLAGIEIEAVNWFSIYHVHHRVADHFRLGRCFIAGDAGHIHSPAGGQGMNTGIGDAVNLSWKLAAVLAGRADPLLLESYELERIRFARTLVKTTDRAFRRMVGQGWGSQILRRCIVPYAMACLMHFSAGRHLLFNTVAQLRIRYRESHLSEGHAAHLYGGDRLPWVAGIDGGNFAPLTALNWQLHIYGEAGAALRDTAAELNLPLHVFPWSDLALAAGLQRDAAYLLRPDAYIGWVSPRQDATALAKYVARLGLRFN